jgi:hypothetical protein
LQLVSILVPAFNAEGFLRPALESALAQTWPRTEVIVVDDGSRDATPAIAQSFAGARVKVVSQENRGASAARNRALSLAQGDYIQWLDADDLLAPDKVARQMELAEPGGGSRVLFSGEWGRFFHCPQRARLRPSPLWQDLPPAEWLYRKLEQNLWMAVESWLVSRKLTEMAGPWNEMLTLDDDGEYFSRVLSNATEIRFVPGAKSFCRGGAPGVSTITPSKLDSQSASILAYVQRMRSLEDSPRTRAACLKLLQRWTISFYPERQDILEEWQQVAAGLGGRLETPRLRPKYRWMQKTLGWRAARRAQRALPEYRTLLEKNWERLLCLRYAGKK